MEGRPFHRTQPRTYERTDKSENRSDNCLQLRDVDGVELPCGSVLQVVGDIGEDRPLGVESSPLTERQKPKMDAAVQSVEN